MYALQHYYPLRPFILPLPERFMPRKPVRNRPELAPYPLAPDVHTPTFPLKRKRNSTKAAQSPSKSRTATVPPKPKATTARRLGPRAEFDPPITSWGNSSELSTPPTTPPVSPSFGSNALAGSSRTLVPSQSSPIKCGAVTYVDDDDIEDDGDDDHLKDGGFDLAVLNLINKQQRTSQQRTAVATSAPVPKWRPTKLPPG